MSEFESQHAELKDLIQRAGATPWGKTCSALWAQAAQLATEIGDEYLEVRCYNELCSAYAMGGEHTKILAPFIWQDKKFKEKPELYDEELSYQLGWQYKYVLSAIRGVPSIPVSKCFEVLEEMRRFYLKHGDTLRSYHIRAFLFYRDFGMYDEAEKAYQNWYTAGTSKLADCSRCDPGYEVTYYTYKKEWKKAAEAADKAMNSGDGYCDSQPEEILTEGMLPWLYCDRDNQAWAAHIRAYRRHQQAPRYLIKLPEHLLYLGISGRAGRPERLERAIKIITRHLPWLKEAEDPAILMHLCAAAGMIFSSPGLETSKILNGTLAGDELSWITAKRLENPSYQQAGAWFMEIARQLAKQFDSRVGHPNPGVTSAQITEIFNPQPAPAPSNKLALPDSTGLGEMENTPYLDSVQSKISAQEIKGQTAPRKSNETDNATDEKVVTHSKAEQSQAEPNMLPPINLYGDWRKLDIPELLIKDMELGANAFSIYGLTLIEMIATNPELTEEQCLELDCTENQTLLDYESIAQSYLNMEPMRFNDTPTSVTAGYDLIENIYAALHDYKPMLAAQLADKAMHTDSPEPLGVRIIALQLMGKAALQAGYYNEAIDSFRQHLNLAAACGLKLIQLQASVDLANLLYRQKEYASAAEVAQTGLDIEHSFPRNSQLILELHRLLAKPSEDMEHYETAAKHHYIIAEAMAEKDPTEAIVSYQAAAIDYSRSLLYPQSFTALQKSLNLCEQVYAEKRKAYLVAEKQLSAAETAGKEPPEAALQARKEYHNILPHLLAAYFLFCKTIVNQPGQVPEGDIQRMENLMQAYRALELDSINIHVLAMKPQAVEADWNADMGYMYAQCYKYQLAGDYLRAAIAGFENIGDMKRTAETYLLLAQLYMVREDFEQAQEICETVLDLLKEPKWIGSQIRSQANQMIRKIKNIRPENN